MDKKVDEQILDFINETEKKEDRKDIKNGPIRIDERYYEFEEKNFFKDKFKIYIPNDFGDMSLEAKRFKYPSENRPEIIKCNEDGSITFTLNLIDSPLDEERVGELKDGMKMIIRKTNPSNVFFDEGIVEVNNKNIGFFEFKSSAIDDFIYNLMFFLEFEEKTLMGTFSCSYKNHKDWRDVAFQVINSIKVIK